MICFDDWNCNQADPAFGERKAMVKLNERFNIRSSPWNGYTWSGHRFIGQSYDGMQS